MFAFRDWNLQNLGLFALANALTFGCLAFVSLHRIIKSMHTRLEQNQERMEELERQVAITKTT
jgi:hypothetical protein